MGNFYEMIKDMKNGDIIESVKGGWTDYRIQKISGVLKYIDKDGYVNTALGRKGVVIQLDNMNEITWSKKPEYVQLDSIDEIANLLRSGETIYIDSSKKGVTRRTELNELNITDIEDVFIYSIFYRKLR